MTEAFECATINRTKVLFWGEISWQYHQKIGQISVAFKRNDNKGR